jgi:uncharacterized protein YdeI (YjbR/CyaY-like superfamily)
VVKVGKTMQFAAREDWRGWLAQHHSTEKELWLIIYKRHVAKTGLSYQEALEEALCFGWIDGTLKRIDDEKHMIRFSPRRSTSIWSKANRGRAEKLIAQGRMTGAGLAMIEQAKKNGEWYRELSDDEGPIIPSDLIEALKRNKKAQKNFENFPPSLQQQFAYWITSAKRPETRTKRIQETVARAQRNERPT